MKQSEKAPFQNYIIKESEVLNTIPLENDVWFIDGMALISCLKPKKTYKEWISALIRFIFPDSSTTLKLLRFINGTYKVKSIKNMPKQKLGTSSTKFNITAFEQNIPQGNTSKELLKDSEYKVQLIKMISVPEYYQDLVLLLSLQEKKKTSRKSSYKRF